MSGEDVRVDVGVVECGLYAERAKALRTATRAYVIVEQVTSDWPPAAGATTLSLQ